MSNVQDKRLILVSFFFPSIPAVLKVQCAFKLVDFRFSFEFHK